MVSSRREYGQFDGETPIYCMMCGYDGRDGWTVDRDGIVCPVCLALILARGNRVPDGLTTNAAALIDTLLNRRDDGSDMGNPSTKSDTITP